MLDPVGTVLPTVCIKVCHSLSQSVRAPPMPVIDPTVKSVGEDRYRRLCLRSEVSLLVSLKRRGAFHSPKKGVHTGEDDLLHILGFTDFHEALWLLHDFRCTHVPGFATLYMPALEISTTDIDNKSPSRSVSARAILLLCPKELKTI